ncbi:MAG: hypothetical protein PHI86_07965, partial [Candidatus Omnitrophica bacterium]|nr:hypothetical protein [Candidatus Omnitrophota bacterium]
IFQAGMAIEDSSIKSLVFDIEQRTELKKIYVKFDLSLVYTLSLKLNNLVDGKYVWWQWIVFAVGDIPRTFIGGFFTGDFVIEPWYAGIYTLNWINFFSGYADLQDAFANLSNRTAGA